MSGDNTNKAKSIGGRLLLLACLIPTLWLFYERIDLLRHAELQSAIIVKCEQRSNGSGPSFTPLAITEQGVKVRGTLWWASHRLCAGSLHKDASVWIHLFDPEQNRINSFFQFWMSPILLAYLSAAIAIGLYGRGRGLAQVLTVLLLVTVGISYVRELHPTSVRPDKTGRLDKSQQVLERCVTARMREKGLADRREVKHLLCQGAGITDLSSIGDLANLEELYLQDNRLSSLDTLPLLPRLKRISVAGNGMTSLRGIERAPNLQELQANLNRINDLSGVQHLHQLRVVGLMKNRLKGITEFAGLSELQDIVLNYNQVTDITPLANKPALEKLQVYANNVRDITPLYGNVKMTIVGVRGRGNIPCDQVRTLRGKLAPAAKVWGPEGC